MDDAHLVHHLVSREPFGGDGVERVVLRLGQRCQGQHVAALAEGVEAHLGHDAADGVGDDVGGAQRVPVGVVLAVARRAGVGHHRDVANVALGLGDTAAVGDELHVADGESGLDGGAVGVDALVVRAIRAVAKRGGVGAFAQRQRFAEGVVGHRAAAAGEHVAGGVVGVGVAGGACHGMRACVAGTVRVIADVRLVRDVAFDVVLEALGRQARGGGLGQAVEFVVVEGLRERGVIGLHEAAAVGEDADVVVVVVGALNLQPVAQHAK